MVNFLAETKQMEPELFETTSANSPITLDDFQRARLFDRTNEQAAFNMSMPEEAERLHELANRDERDREFVFIVADYLVGKLMSIGRFGGFLKDNALVETCPNDKYLFQSTHMSMSGWPFGGVLARIGASEESLELTTKLTNDIFQDCCLIAHDVYGEHLHNDRLGLWVGTRALAPTEIDWREIIPARMAEIRSGIATVFELGGGDCERRKERFTEVLFPSVFELQIRTFNRRPGAPYYEIHV